MTKRNRDDLIDRALRAGAHAEPWTAGSPDCLDGETLAAWVQGGLGRTAREAAEAHASQCARCQAVLAMMARGDEAQIGEAPEPSRKRFWQMMPWLGPLTAATATAIVWMAVRPAPDVQLPAPQAPAQQQAKAEEDLRRQAPPASDHAPPAEPAPSRTSARPLAGNVSGTAREGSVAQKETGVAGALMDEARRAPSMPPATAPDARAVGSTPAPSLPSQPLPPAAPPPAVTGSAASAAPPAAAEKPRLERQAARFAAERADALQESVNVSVTIPTPDANVFWRVSGTNVQRTVDRGATWAVQQTGTTTPLLAGSAPSPTVCWVVGRAGAVLLTTDGRTWTRVPFPHDADLVRVTAESAAAATITAADGRTLRTADGGKTWATPR